MSDSVVGLTSDQASAMRRERAVTARATATAASAGDVVKSGPSFGGRNFRPGPVQVAASLSLLLRFPYDPRQRHQGAADGGRRGRDRFGR